MTKIISVENDRYQNYRYLVFKKSIYNLIVDNKIKLKNIHRIVFNTKIFYGVRINFICEDTTLPIYKLNRSNKGILYPSKTTWKWDDIKNNSLSITEKDNVLFDLVGDIKTISKIKMLNG